MSQMTEDEFDILFGAQETAISNLINEKRTIEHIAERRTKIAWVEFFVILVLILLLVTA